MPDEERESGIWFTPNVNAEKAEPSLEARPSVWDSIEVLEGMEADPGLSDAEVGGSEPAFLEPEAPRRQDRAPRGPPSVDIVMFPSRGFQTALIDVLAEAADEFDGCLLISATLPYKHLVRIADQAGLPLESFRVIDMVSAMDRNGFQDSGRVAYVSSPTLLEKVMLLAFDAVHASEGSRHCIIVDSMSTLGFYNENVALEQFTHRLTSLARMSDWGARFLMNDHPKNRELLAHVAHLFDEVSPLNPRTAPPASAPEPRPASTDPESDSPSFSY